MVALLSGGEMPGHCTDGSGHSGPRGPIAVVAMVSGESIGGSWESIADWGGDQ